MSIENITKFKHHIFFTADTSVNQINILFKVMYMFNKNKYSCFEIVCSKCFKKTF